MSALSRKSSFSSKVDDEYVSTPERERRRTSVADTTQVWKMTLSGNEGHSFFSELAQGGSILPRVQAAAIRSIKAGDRIEISVPGAEESPARPRLFDVDRVQTFSSFEERFKKINWQVLVPWATTSEQALSTVKQLPNGHQDSIHGTVALHLSFYRQVS